MESPFSASLRGGWECIKTFAQSLTAILLAFFVQDQAGHLLPIGTSSIHQSGHFLSLGIRGIQDGVGSYGILVGPHQRDVG